MVAIRSRARQLAMLLAASGFTEADVEALMGELRTTKVTDILDWFSADRGRLGQQATSSQVALPTEVDENAVPDSPVMGAELAKEVERLLLIEAGLTKGEAAIALTRALRKRSPSFRRIPPFNSKDGFGKWLRDLSFAFPLSEIMHTAAIIRNSRVHGVGDDWLGNR